MTAPEDLTGLLPPAPPGRPLPRHGEHRAELLAVIAAGERLRPRPAPPRWRPARRWLVPLTAAAAVLAVLASVALVQARSGAGGHREPGAAPGPGPQVTGTVVFSTASGHPRARHALVSGAVRQLTVSAGAGSITVAGSERATVAITAQLSYHGRAPVMQGAVRDGRLVLGYRCAAGTECGVSYVLQVPRGVTVRARTGAGDVRLTGLTGSVTASVGTGDISLSGLSGPVRAQDRTGDVSGRALRSADAALSSGIGDIDVSFTRPPGRLVVTDKLGPVMIRVPGSVSYRVQAGSGLGSVSIGVPRLAGSPHRITATSQLGDVAIVPGG
jgi:hypothetical protein